MVFSGLPSFFPRAASAVSPMMPLFVFLTRHDRSHPAAESVTIAKRAMCCLGQFEASSEQTT
jgi:hypothetical protein